MRNEVLVDEPIDVLVRTLSNGTIQPTSFLWRDKTRYVGGLGRQWEERVRGEAVRCFLVQAVDNQTFELRWRPAANAWTLHRAWLNTAVA